MTNEMKTVWGKMMVVINGTRWGSLCEDIEDVKEVLNEYLSEEGQEELEKADIEIYNVVGDPLHDGIDFTVGFDYEAPYIGEPSEGTTDSYEYKVEDTGKEFDNIDDLKEYLAKLISSGDYTSDEVKRFDITQTMVNTITFDDAQEGDIYTTLEMKARQELDGKCLIDKYHGRRFMLADELESHIDSKVNEILSKRAQEENEVQDVNTMTDEEIKAEISLLHQRLVNLKAVHHMREMDALNKDLLS